jgi:nickel-dependent lactate racemase
VLFFGRGSKNDILKSADIRQGLFSALDKLGAHRKVLAIPPDFSRVHSQTGMLTKLVFKYYGDRLTDILPAIGTHAPMSNSEITSMFGDVPQNLFRVHHWRKDLISLGEVPAEFVSEISESKVHYSWPVQVNKLFKEGNFDLILSLGQVVPHEVIGMANYNKNILVGTGGLESIHKSHFLGAVYGMERIMGKIDNPVRRLLNYAGNHFLRNLPIIYILTVVERQGTGELVVRGLFIGDDEECFIQAARLSLEVNFMILDNPLRKVLVYLDPQEFKSTWLGNKSIYRTRMAITNAGELIVLAPGVHTFGEDPEIDHLIRKYFNYANLSEMLKKYQPEKLKQGTNILPDGEEIFFISNPALGLWAAKEKLN